MIHVVGVFPVNIHDLYSILIHAQSMFSNHKYPTVPMLFRKFSGHHQEEVRRRRHADRRRGRLRAPLRRPARRGAHHGGHRKGGLQGAGKATETKRWEQRVEMDGLKFRLVVFVDIWDG